MATLSRPDILSGFIFCYVHLELSSDQFGPWVPWGKLNPPGAFSGAPGGQTRQRGQADKHFLMRTVAPVTLMGQTFGLRGVN